MSVSFKLHVEHRWGIFYVLRILLYFYFSDSKLQDESFLSQTNKLEV